MLETIAANKLLISILILCAASFIGAIRLDNHIVGLKSVESVFCSH